MSSLAVFNFESQEIRLLGTSDNPWWVASDICTVLDIKNSRDALSRLDGQ
jgi:prophage antirepressor-like protein